ncbi:MAG: hypothetical protein HKN94_14950 [Acidimicrobiales bacterium]|nr:hypothetical protein [Acidimicrobiales bacterium]
MSSSVLRRVSAAIALIAITLVSFAAPAAAHDPIFLSDDQTTPDTGPFMPDATISWALYGQVLGDGDTRGFEFDLRDGDELFVGLLIPNLEPELQLADDELPVLTISRPDGTTIDIVAEERVVFDEPFTKTSYVNLAELREPGMGGRYEGIVTGNAAARFSVAIGETELFFTDAERTGDRPSSFQEIEKPLRAWYTTPPGGEPTGELVEGDAEVDLDLIGEAMESGEGALAEGVDEDAVMADTTEGSENDEADVAVEEESVAESTDAATDSTTDDIEESAAAPPAGTDGDDGGGSTWVAPVAIMVLALGAGGFALSRRRNA